MPRTARVAPGGVVFHVMNRANPGLVLFDSDGDYAAFESVLAEALEAFPRMRLLAYCAMPNHWHLVLWPRDDGDLGRFVQRLTVTHVRRWHEYRKTTGRGHVYQGTYKSFPVQNDAHLMTLCRYVERNALRAKMAKRAEDWRWSSLWLREEREGGSGGRARKGRAIGAGGAADRSAARAGAAGDVSDSTRPKSPPLDDWPVDRPADWVAFVNAPQTDAEEQAVADSIRRGRPFGAPTWQTRTAAKLGLEATFRPRGRPRKEK